MESAMPLPYRLSTTVILTAVTATAGFFLFARPQYRDPTPGQQFDLSYVKLPHAAAGAAGWAWPTPTPGFEFGHDEPVWNDAKLHASDLDPARAASIRADVAPTSLRVLAAQRGPGDRAPFALLSGTDASHGTCVAPLVGSSVSFYCPSTTATHRLGRQVAFVVAEAKPPVATKKYGALYPFSMLAVARGDVTAVVLDLPGLHRWTIYRRDWALGNLWGTFGAQLELPRAWHGQLRFYGRSGLLAKAPLDSNERGARLLTP
jgi:hypothetical protein